jgi:hypothetical protein
MEGVAGRLRAPCKRSEGFRVRRRAVSVFVSRNHDQPTMPMIQARRRTLTSDENHGPVSDDVNVVHGFVLLGFARHGGPDDLKELLV